MIHPRTLWMRLIGITLAIPIVQTIAIEAPLAQHLPERETDKTTESIVKLVAQLNPQSQQITNTGTKATGKVLEYLVSAKRKYQKQDYRGAISDYDRAIAIDPKLAQAYNHRGYIKAGQLQDYRGGLADMNRAIAIDPKLADAYRYRAELKTKALHDVQGGLADYNRAIQLNPKYGLAYGDRAVLKHDTLNDKSGGIADLKAAIELFQQQGDTNNYRVAAAELKKWQQNRNDLYR